MNSREFLEELMRRAEENPNSLSQKTKVPQPTLFRFLSGTAKEPRLSTFEPIARHYGVPVEAFLSDRVRAEVVAKMTGKAPPGPVAAPKATAPGWPFGVPFSAFAALGADAKDEIERFIKFKISEAKPSRGGQNKEAA